MYHFKCLFLTSILFFSQREVFAVDLAITMDDPMVEQSKEMSYQEVNEMILKTLSDNHVKAFLFVCGKRVDTILGKSILKAWDDQGHGLGDHSYSHFLFETPKMTLAKFISDVDHNDAILNGFRHRVPFFRFPFLHEGNTKELRDGFRKYLHEHHLKNGYVTVDASDWYISERLVTAQNSGLKNLSKYRDYYISHILNRVRYYDQLAQKVLGRSPKHTLLIHHNVLNALYLGDLIQALKKAGIKMINAQDAYLDPLAMESPEIVPAGQSLIWALAKATGKFDSELRYPGEDGAYQKAEMDSLGL